MWIRAILVVLLLCLLILRCLKLLQIFKKYPPGPPVLLLPLALLKTGFRIDRDRIAEETKEYGDIYTLWAATRPLVMLRGFQAIKEVLIKHSETFSGVSISLFYKEVVQGRGISNSNGHAWKQQRKFAITTLRKLGLGKQVLQNQIQNEARQLVENFAHAKGQPMDPSVPIANSICNVIFALLFGCRYSMDDQEFIKLLEILKFMVTFGTSFPFIMYEGAPWLMKHIKWPYKKFLANRDFVIQKARKETELHRAQLAVHDPRDYIDYYLLQIENSKNDPTSTFNEDNLFQCIFDLMFAGVDTNTAVLKWGLLLMVTYPDIQEKVQKEIEDAFGPSQIIGYQDRKRLPYTYAVIHEIMRFKCILPTGSHRQCLQDVTILGCPIPKGTTIVPDIQSVLYDSMIWETPRKFNPNHFLDRDGKFVDREELIIFSAGARTCLGKDLAMMELFIFFTSLLRAFTLSLPEGVTEANLEPLDGIIMYPRPYKVCTVPRYSES